MTPITGAAISADAWMAAVTAAATEVASVALGGRTAQLVRRAGAAPPDGAGAYVQLVGDVRVMIGLIAEPAVADRLARALLGSADADPALTPVMVMDAMGELVNILAGGIKRRMHGRISSLQLGLPVFLQGHLEPTPRIDVVIADLRLGELSAVMIVALPHA